VSRFGRLMIAQDTGSALVGPARADLYWGAGDDAGRIAGRIRHPGRFAMLVPRELDLVAVGRQMPLPVPKPKIPEVEVDKTDGKGNAPPPNAGAIATGKELPTHPTSPAPKPKMAASDVKKEVKNEDGKGKATSANNTGATVAGKQLPKHPASPAPKSKMPESGVKKRDGKGKANSANTASSGEDWRATASSGRPAAPARMAN
jgi:membrane-bound lytic murein transglycosylase A